MKRLIVLALLASAAGVALAGNSNGCQGNCPGGDTTTNNNYDQRTYSQGGAGGAGGNASAGAVAGAIAGAAAGASADVRSTNTNANTSTSRADQTQTASATGGAASATGGSASATGNGAGNSTSVTFEGSTYREAAQTAYAPATVAPRVSCRIFVGLGGSSRDGSLSGGIPIGNDQSCLSGLQIELMDKVNRVAPGTFVGKDYLAAACKVEGMEAAAACKK